MQLLGILIFVGILVVLLAAAMYFGNTQKTPNRRSGSALDDLYSSKGMGNVINANEVMRENLSSREQRRRGRGEQRQRQKQK